MKNKAEANEQPMDGSKGKNHPIDKATGLKNNIDKMDNTLWQFEENVGRILEFLPEMAFMTDTKGKFLFTNRSWSEYTGYSHAEATAINIFDLTHPDYLEVIKERFIEVLEGNSHRDFEFKSKSKDGSYVDVQINLSPMLGSEGKVVATCGIGKDIVEYRNIKMGLKESQEIYKSIVETQAQAGGGIIMLQNIGNTEGVILFANDEALRITGYTQEELIGQTIQCLIAPDNPPDLMDRYKRRQAGEALSDYPELSLLRKDGTVVHVEYFTSFTTYQGKTASIAHFRDITELKNVEKALLEAQDIHRSLLEVADRAGQGISIIQTIGDQEGIVVDANEECLRLTGYSRQELIGNSFQILLPADELTELLDRYRRRQAGEEVPVYHELSLVRKDGTTVPVEYYAVLVTYHGNVASIAYFREITERKQAEKALLESQDMYKSMVETANKAGIGIGIVQNVGNKEGIVVSVNDEVLNITGYTREELIGKAFQDILVCDSLSDFIERYKRRQAGEELPGYTELCILRKDGTKIPVECNAGVTTYQNEVATIAYIKDVTERKQAEDSLQQGKEYFKALIENAYDVTMIVDVHGHTKYISPSIKQLQGYETDEFMSKNPFDLVHLDDLQMIIDEFAETVKKPEHFIHTELRVRHKNGSWRKIEATSNNLLGNPYVAGIVINCRDITERKQMEEELHESELKFKTIFDTALDGICLAEVETLQLYTANKMFCQILGYKLEEIEEMVLADIHPKQDLPYVLEQFIRQAGGEIQLAKDIPMLRKDGSIFYADVNASSLTIGGKEYLMGIFRDITERKLIEGKYRQLLEDMKDGYCVLQDTNVVFANKRCSEIFGYKPGQGIGRSVAEFIAPDDLQKLEELYTKILNGEEEAPERLEVIGVKKDGTMFPLQTGARLIEYEGKPAYSVILRDITEHKRMDELLHESQEKLQSIIHAIPDILSHFNQDGTFMDEPMGRYDLSEQYPSTFFMENIYNIFPSDFADIAIKAIKTVLNDGVPQVIEHKLPIPLLNKEENTYETRIVPLGRSEVLAISRDITAQKQAENKLHAYQMQLQSLSSQLSQAEERERRRLAEDLHDLVGQSLAVIKMKLNAWKDTLYSSGHASSMMEVVKLLEHTINNTRSLTFDLSPPVLYELGLEAALEFLLEQFQERHGLEYEFRDDNQEKPLEDEVRILLYRCTSELLMNVVKHSQAQHVKLSIYQENSHISITLKDNGVGFYIPEGEFGEVQGFGLFSIRERLNWIGGSFKLESNPGRGTLAILRAPLKYDEE